MSFVFSESETFAVIKKKEEETVITFTIQKRMC